MSNIHSHVYKIKILRKQEFGAARSTRKIFVHWCFQIKLEFQNVDLCGGRKTGEPRGPLEQGKNQQQTQPTCDVGSVLQWWEASALTTAPSVGDV